MKIAIVTGASSGMGRQFVLQLSEYTSVDEIWVIARRESALESLKGAVSVPVRPVPLDLMQDESFQRFAELLQTEHPDVRLLVNAAGFGKFGSHDKIPLEDECGMIDLNCKALVRMTRICLPYMTEGSHILQLDSLSAFQPVPYITTYAATKAFVLSYTRGMNQELKPRNIRMMALNPGWVKTEFFNHAMASDRDSEVRYFNRLYEAEKVVATGLHHLYHSRRDYCVPGFSVRAQTWLVKILPHSLVMKIWMNQQKTAKNRDGLTTN